MRDHDVVVGRPPTNENDADGRLDQSIAEELVARARAEGVCASPRWPVTLVTRPGWPWVDDTAAPR